MTEKQGPTFTHVSEVFGETQSPHSFAERSILEQDDPLENLPQARTRAYFAHLEQYEGSLRQAELSTMNSNCSNLPDEIAIRTDTPPAVYWAVQFQMQHRSNKVLAAFSYVISKKRYMAIVEAIIFQEAMENIQETVKNLT